MVMFKLTTRAAYSIKALLDLAMYSEQHPVAGRHIAERQHIPPAYLEKILLDLRQAKLIRSQRGSQGGYRLARSPRLICLSDILQAVGESLHPLEPADPSVVADGVMQAVWNRLSQALHQVLQQTTLEDLYFDARSRQAAQSPDSEFMV